MLSSVLILLFFLGQSGENLLRNPSFENAEGGKPTDWALFVMAKEGSEGRLDDKIFWHGSRSAVLLNAKAYEDEPNNNWSQNIVKDLVGKTLIFGGLIKTEKADGADIWLQCWRKDPWGVVSVARAGDTSPLSGTHDWTPVAAKVSVPKETDFVTLRCVLKGAGTVWFDDMRVIDAGAKDTVEDEVEDLAKSVSAGKGQSKKEVERGLLRDAKSLAEGVKALKETNESVEKELSQVREELKDLKRQLEKARPGLPGSAAEKAAVSPELGKGPRVPPLVPHGSDWKELVNAS